MTPFPISLRTGITLGLILVIFCLIFAVLTMCQQGARNKAALQTENATGRALDKAAVQIDAARKDAKEKQDEADKIPGADNRLPDGYGARLECVRRGGECRNP